MNRRVIVNAATVHEWDYMGPQKMWGLLSFMKGNERMNVYMSTGTVTFQNTLKKYDHGESYKDLNDETFVELLKNRR